MKRNKQLERDNTKAININIVFISKENMECVQLQNPLPTNRFKVVSQQKTIYNSNSQYFKQPTYPRNDSTNNIYNFSIPLNQIIDLNAQTFKNSTCQKKTIKNKKTRKQEAQLNKNIQKRKQRRKSFCKQLGYKNKIKNIYKLNNLENKNEVNVNVTISKKIVENKNKQHKISQQSKIIKEKRNNSNHNNLKNQKKKQRKSLSYIQKNKSSIFSKPPFIPFSQSQQDPTFSNQKSLSDNYQDYKQEIIIFLHVLAIKIQKVWRGYYYRKQRKQLKKNQINQQYKQIHQNIRTATFLQKSQKVDNQQAKFFIMQNSNQLNLVVFKKLSVQTQTETILNPYQINHDITFNEKYAQTISQLKKSKDQQIQVKSQKKYKYKLQSLPQYFLKQSKLLQIVQIGNQILMMKQKKKIQRIKKMYQKFVFPKTFREIHQTTKEKLSKFNKSNKLFQIGWKNIFQNFLDIRNTINKNQKFHLSDDRSIIKQYKNNSYIFRQVLNYQICLNVDKHLQSFKNSEQQLSPILKNQNILQILEQDYSFQKQIKIFNYTTQTNQKIKKKKIQQIKSQNYLKQIENKIIDQLLIDFMKEDQKIINKNFKKNKENKIILFKGFDTSHDKVNQYLLQISSFILHKYKFQLCSRINQIQGPKPEQILILLRPNNQYQLKNHQNILPIQIYQQFQYNIMALNNQMKQNYTQQQGFQLELIHLHNRVIFDAINQSLQYQRPYGIQGQPLPWKKIQKKQSNYRIMPQMKNIMQEAINRVSSFCSYELGNLKMQGIQKEIYEDIRRTKVLEYELRQQDPHWSNFDQQITYINEIISYHIYNQIIFQFVKIFQQ